MMKEVLSLFMSIGEMDTAYIVIALVVILGLWILFKVIGKKSD